MQQTKDLAVLYIITKLELGGAQKVTLSLVDELTKQNVPTYLISGTEGPLVNQIKDNPNAILLKSFKREISPKNIFYDFKTFFALIRTIRKLKKKHPKLVVHTHSTKAGILGRWAAFFAGAHQRIHTIHGFGFHPHQNAIVWGITYLIELLTSFVTTHFVCVSQADRTTGTELFPFFKKKSSIIRAAVDHKQFYTPARKTLLDRANQPFTFGTIACFKPQKNLFDLLKAFHYVHQFNPNTRLEIIGDGVQRPALEAWITEHNLSEAVVLHGWKDNVAPVMYHWNAFTLSSLWEGLPCAVIEARLLKLPVISYNTGGICEVIKHNVNGLIYPQRAWQQLAHGMLTLSSNPELYTRLTNNPDKLDDFDTQVMVEKHHNLYCSL